ncbi:MAG TPA: hypothetical protein VHC63_13535 [Acidimicrobiales bacterium]|nr:hypothetical protein [Acidimicrobiales bacterium]
MAIEVFVGGGDPPSIGKKALTDELDRAHQGRARQVNTAAALSGKIDRLTPGQRATIEALVDQLLGED